MNFCLDLSANILPEIFISKAQPIQNIQKIKSIVSISDNELEVQSYLKSIGIDLEKEKESKTETLQQIIRKKQLDDLQEFDETFDQSISPLNSI